MIRKKVRFGNETKKKGVMVILVKLGDWENKASFPNNKNTSVTLTTESEFSSACSKAIPSTSS